jgi:hypothetical protein
MFALFVGDIFHWTPFYNSCTAYQTENPCVCPESVTMKMFIG